MSATEINRAPSPRADYLYGLALQACIYCWPLFEMQRMRAATSARKAPSLGFAGDSPESTLRWCNLFTNERELLTAGKSRVVMPNNDTLYVNAWLNLSDGPLVITTPDTGDRYYVLGLLDYYTNPFAHIGTRATGNGAGRVLVSGPGWHGVVPVEFQVPGRHVQSSTDWVWIIGRILVDGPHDVAVVNRLQDQFLMGTLDDWRAGRSGQPSRFDSQFVPRAPFSADRFLALVNDALHICPPPAVDAMLVAQFKAVGIGSAPGATLPNDARAALERACGTAQRLLDSPEGDVFGDNTDRGAKIRRPAWQRPVLLGDSFGFDLLRRAFISRQAIGMLATVEAAYPRRETDADGGLTLTIQHAPPLDSNARANWLPAPEDGFFLCLRAYLPKAELLNGSYQLPDPMKNKPLAMSQSIGASAGPA